jgi:hypothetical protein
VINPFSAEPEAGTVLRITMPPNWAQTVYIMHRAGTDSPYQGPPLDPKCPPKAMWWTSGSDIWEYWPDVCDVIEKAISVEIANWETA